MSGYVDYHGPLEPRPDFDFVAHAPELGVAPDDPVAVGADVGLTRRWQLCRDSSDPPCEVLFLEVLAFRRDQLGQTTIGNMGLKRVGVNTVAGLNRIPWRR